MEDVRGSVKRQRSEGAEEALSQEEESARAQRDAHSMFIDVLEKYTVDRESFHRCVNEQSSVVRCMRACIICNTHMVMYVVMQNVCTM